MSKERRVLERPRFDGFLCFDANMAKLRDCTGNCEIDERVLCIHRFEPKVRVIRIAKKNQQGWSDHKVLQYFISEILKEISQGTFDLRKCFFMIITKDQDFIEDVKRDLEEESSEIKSITFLEDSIICDGITILVSSVNGVDRTHDLQYVSTKVNKFFRTGQR